jgi:Ca-activated chloride channel family protein
MDADGRTTGYKRDEGGNAVVSRLDMTTLEAIARGTGGQAFRITPADTSLSGVAAALEGMEQKSLAREFSYRRKERFQVPLAIGLGCLALGLLLPVPPLRRKATTAGLAASTAARAAGIALLLLSSARPAPAQTPPPSPSGPAPAPQGEGPARRGTLMDEVLLRPRRATEQGRGEYARGSHPQALEAFERAAKARPQDPAVRFNVAAGLYKNGRYDEAATLFKSLGSDAASPLAGAARYNLGNSLYQKQDYKGAIQAYRDALRALPGDADLRRNLELALRKLQEQEEQKKRDQQQERDDQKKDQDKQDQKGEPKPNPNPQQGQNQRPQTPEEKADQRFRQEAGMPKERAMQLLDALQQNEKAEQQKALALKRAQRKKGKDW